MVWYKLRIKNPWHEERYGHTFINRNNHLHSITSFSFILPLFINNSICTIRRRREVFFDEMRILMNNNIQLIYCGVQDLNYWHYYGFILSLN